MYAMVTSVDRGLFISALALHLSPGQIGKTCYNLLCLHLFTQSSPWFWFSQLQHCFPQNRDPIRFKRSLPIPVWSGPFRSSPVRSTSQISSWKTRLQSCNKIRAATKQDVCSFMWITLCPTQYSVAVVFYRMGKRYHCEYCNRSFADTPHTRKNHINGVQHKRNRKLHYDSFKGTYTFYYSTWLFLRKHIT